MEENLTFGRSKQNFVSPRGQIVGYWVLPVVTTVERSCYSRHAPASWLRPKRGIAGETVHVWGCFGVLSCGRMFSAGLNCSKLNTTVSNSRHPFCCPKPDPGSKRGIHNCSS